MQTNIVIQADNRQALQAIPDGTIHLVYCDPPFLTGRDFIEFNDNPDTHKTERPPAFEWLNTLTTPKVQAYFADIIPRLIEIERILSPTGALYWHCDYRTSNYIRLILDQVFGKPAFRNEIVWAYNSTAIFDSIKHRWKNNFDKILFYAKKNHDFQPQYHPLTYKQSKTMYPYTDSKGRRYRHRNDASAHSHYDVREYADENKGSRITTTWTDIPIVAGKARTGYPTQKPIQLLKRIIQASSKKDEIVLDPYCGSGTTLIAAKQLNRKYIGIDINPEAVYIAKKRLK